MATITFQLVQKPIEQRIIDAACVYYDVDRTYFHKGKRSPAEVVERRNVLYYLMKSNKPEMPWEQMAQLFGFSSIEPVMEGVRTIDARQNVSRELSRTINAIQALADQLDADFIERDVVLVNNVLKIKSA